MLIFLRLAHLIDRCNERIGNSLAWLVLVAVLISAANAVVRKAFNYSSNAFLEIQWYMFAALFLLGAGYTMLRQEHVKIDLVLARFSKRTAIIVECFCIVLFLWPTCVLIVGMVWPIFINAYVSGEASSNAGGLIRWPVYALVPLGFTLLGLQGLSELIKRVAFLRGIGDDPTVRKQKKTAEEELAEVIRRQDEGAKP